PAWQWRWRPRNPAASASPPARGQARHRTTVYACGMLLGVETLSPNRTTNSGGKFDEFEIGRAAVYELRLYYVMADQCRAKSAKTGYFPWNSRPTADAAGSSCPPSSSKSPAGR